MDGHVLAADPDVTDAASRRPGVWGWRHRDGRDEGTV
jgi:hypothetical protein